MVLFNSVMFWVPNSFSFNAALPRRIQFYLHFLVEALSAFKFVLKYCKLQSVLAAINKITKQN
jgi:hypothetical protein